LELPEDALREALVNALAHRDYRSTANVQVQSGTIWLSQKNMGELFMTSSDNIGLHLKNIFKKGELNATSVAEEFSVTAA